MIKSLIKLDFLRFGILNSRYDWLDLILKISLGHKKHKTRKGTKMKRSVGYCSFEYHTYYIFVSPNIDFRTLLRTLRPSDAFFSWTQDAGSSDARRGQFGRKTRTLWTQDAGAVDARRGRRGRRTRSPWTQDAGRHSVKLFLGSTILDFHRKNICVVMQSGSVV